MGRIHGRRSRCCGHRPKFRRFRAKSVKLGPSPVEIEQVLPILRPNRSPEHHFCGADFRLGRLRPSHGPPHHRYPIVSYPHRLPASPNRSRGSIVLTGRQDRPRFTKPIIRRRCRYAVRRVTPIHMTRLARSKRSRPDIPAGIASSMSHATRPLVRQDALLTMAREASAEASRLNNPQPCL